MRRKVHLHKVRIESDLCVSMKDELAAVEQFGADLGEEDASSYMFLKEEDVDMNAFCDRYLDKQLLGASSDAASYFDQLSERFGFACRKELEDSKPSPTPTPTPPPGE